MLKYLIDSGADVAAQTSGVGASGGTVLWWAKQILTDNHPVTSYLEGIGAPDFDL